MSTLILTLNGGSSSIKFAAFESAPPPKRLFGGQVERIGTPGAQLVFKRAGSSASDTQPVAAATYDEGTNSVLTYLREQVGAATVAGIGHRIVHGGVNLLRHQLLTDEIVAELRRVQPLDLAHLPREIALIDRFRAEFPNVPQVACLDTAFHRDMPRVARMLPIPFRYYEAGVRRLGFHGLSYTYLMKRLGEVAGPEAARGRVILAHLGSGASMVAVKGGKPLDTTMAFTPTAGLVMGTRPGDMDPGLLIYLMRDQKLSPEDMDKFISEQCGMLGVSGTSSDMRDLIERGGSDPRAVDAVSLFCYQARKFVGALAAALDGLDTLVFSGGIGEHSPQARAGICDGLECLGIHFDSGANAAGRDIISSGQSRVVVRVIPTDEESIIAEEVSAILRQRL